MQQTKERPAARADTRQDTFATLLVHAEPGAAASKRIEVAARLARELDAKLIGLGAEAFAPLPTPDPFSGFSGAEWVTLVQEQLDKNLKAAEAAFRRHAAAADIQWRVIQEPPHKALARTAKAADLIIVSPRQASPTMGADPAEVVMRAGRPVLVAPERPSYLRRRCVVVAFKDTRECRRAITDALPFLRRAEEVIVHAVCSEGDEDDASVEIADVVANLKRRGVEARPIVTTAEPDQVASELERVAQANGADLIVAGAYGHNRLREWAFGGVTNDFITRPGVFVLLSH